MCEWWVCGEDFVLIGVFVTSLGWWGVGNDVFSLLGGGCLVRVGGRSGGLLLLFLDRRVLSGKLWCV